LNFAPRAIPTRVQTLIARLEQERASKLDLKADRVVEELRRLAFSNMLDYPHPGQNGDLRLDFSKLTRDQAAAIQEIREDTTGA